jgi:uncharacterized protein involved in outer membrane biogenesis
MARIDRAEIVIDLLKLLQGEIVLPVVNIRKPDLLLETRPDCRPNWQFDLAEEASRGPPLVPRIGHRQSPILAIVESTPEVRAFPPPALPGLSGTMTLSDARQHRRSPRPLIIPAAP